MPNFEYIPPTLAEKCVQFLPSVPCMGAWKEMCIESTILEGPEPMLHASKMWIRVGHDPEVRKIMRSAGEARQIYLQMQSRL
jgi:hypothetical protein